jgi:hypothetical protein
VIADIAVIARERKSKSPPKGGDMGPERYEFLPVEAA